MTLYHLKSYTPINTLVVKGGNNGSSSCLWSLALYPYMGAVLFLLVLPVNAIFDCFYLFLIRWRTIYVQYTPWLTATSWVTLYHIHQYVALMIKAVHSLLYITRISTCMSCCYSLLMEGNYVTFKDLGCKEHEEKQLWSRS